MIIYAQLSCAVRQKFGYQLISKSFVAISLLTKMKKTSRERLILMPKVYLYVCDEILFDNLWVFHDYESLGLSWQFKKSLMINMLQLFVF